MLPRIYYSKSLKISNHLLKSLLSKSQFSPHPPLLHGASTMYKTSLRNKLYLLSATLNLTDKLQPIYQQKIPPALDTRFL